MTPRAYILWDWNGTLLDDTQAALDALNAMLARRGLPSVGMTWFRDNFRFPVRPFYESMGIRVRDDEWDALAREYHETYLRQSRALALDACAALELARSAGAGQVIVSALRQDLLERDVAQYGIGEFFAGLYGTDNLDGAAKISAARKAAATLVGSAAAVPPRLVVIGDSRHDREAADAVGAACVLQSCGTHTRARLEPFAPVADSLTEAVRLALRRLGLEGKECE